MTAPPTKFLGSDDVGVGLIAIAKEVSGNKKLGNAATTHAAQVSCPESCVFFDGGGCYAETGRQGKFVTKPLNDRAAEVGAGLIDVARAEAAAIDGLVDVVDRPLRLHTVGDCKTDEAARLVSAAAERYMERGGGPVWTYTHAWRDVERASWGRVSVLASCETPMDVADARERGYATSMVVEEYASDSLYELDETFVLPCPQMTRGVSCTDCRLCFDDGALFDRDYSIAFEVHGIPFAQRQARLALVSPDDPLRRMPSEERIRIIRERYLETGREPTVQEVAEEIDLNPSSVWEWLRFLRGETDHPAEMRRQRDARRKKAVA